MRLSSSVCPEPPARHFNLDVKSEGPVHPIARSYPDRRSRQSKRRIPPTYYEPIKHSRASEARATRLRKAYKEERLVARRETTHSNNAEVYTMCMRV
jgi:hypothetical protein